MKVFSARCWKAIAMMRYAFERCWCSAVPAMGLGATMWRQYISNRSF
ncbi:MAG TPA: hypothetical protein PKY35_02865 [Candidatus Hydrogenedentes bacterium]|nr:hypothetical protein [Candidatus Hydrogenedentota bacterium]HOL75944.1 hypothetical protein [Candidatus Hydrogenedentota bacterium]HPO85647.1 hypothetical protein [Candidatus Hydrogenedentota bacterium]